MYIIGQLVRGAALVALNLYRLSHGVNGSCDSVCVNIMTSNFDFIDDLYFVFGSRRCITKPMQQKSLVQFRRNRELGIRETTERAVRQRVDIETKSIKWWPLDVKLELYTWMINKQDEYYELSDPRYWDGEECLVETKVNGRYRLVKKRRMMQIDRLLELEKRLCRMYGSAYIAIPAGNGKWVRLIVLNNVGIRHKIICTPAVTQLLDKCEGQCYKLILGNYEVQDRLRFCPTCGARMA